MAIFRQLRPTRRVQHSVSEAICNKTNGTVPTFKPRLRLVPMKSCIRLILLLMLLASSVMASKDTKQQNMELIEHAEEKSKILTVASFEMKADVRIDKQGNPVDGTYVLLWNGPEQWREEISLPGYSEIRVGGKGVVFLKRSTDFIPLSIDQL